MPPKRKTTTRRRVQPKVILVQRGNGLFDSILSVGKTGMDVMNQLGVKPSQVVGLIPHKAAKSASGILGQLGLGQRRRRRVGRPRKTARR